MDSPKVRSKGRRILRFDDDLGVYGLPGDVSVWDLRFDPSDPAHLEPLGAGRLRLRLLAEPGLERGLAVLRTESGVIGVRLDRTRGQRFDVWSADLELEGRARLSFAFRTEFGRPVYLVPSGTSSSVERLDRWVIDPAAPPINVPTWVQGAVIYQIFPERFANGDPSNDPDGTVPWDEPPGSQTFQGGDLDGVTQHLDHLIRLGVDVIYLNPIFASPSNHKYDTVDYMNVDPAFGGNEALRRLITAAHAGNIRVILDASFNHVHPRFFAFADLVKQGKRSRYRDWFVVTDWPVRIDHRPAGKERFPGQVSLWLQRWASEAGVEIREVPGRDGPAIQPSYEAWFGVPTMPRVNLANPETRSYMLGVARYWLEEYDVDGWRMDVVRYVDPDFWTEFRQVCRAVKADAYLLAEIMGDASPWLQGDAFDATMNYSFRSLVLDFFARDEIDGRQMLDRCLRLISRHPSAVTLANHNLLGSHDTPRFRTEAGGEMWRLRLATVFQLTFPGAPGLYYGDEVGLEGEMDPGCRGTFPWYLSEDGLVPDIAALITLRRRFRALRTGSWEPLSAAPNALAFERRDGHSRVVVGINRGQRTNHLPVSGEGDTIWGGGSLEEGVLTIGGHGAVIVRR